MMDNLHLKDEMLVVAVSAADVHNRYFSVPQVSRHFLLQKCDVHFSQFDFEFTSKAFLKFKTLPDEKTFRYLDSLCGLYTAPTIDTTEAVSPLPEPVNTLWSKEKFGYHFSLVGSTQDKKLHSEEAFFSLTINRNSRIAEVRYGSY